jgi:hypothetical protein
MINMMHHSRHPSFFWGGGEFMNTHS